MATALRNLIQRIYPSNDTVRVLIGGLDYTGKTTLLYFLKLGKIVTTIPSLGVNVEAVNVKTSSSKKLDLTLWEVGAGCGGPAFRAMMMKWYLPGAAALIWMVDSTDVRRDESIEQGLKVLLAHADAEMPDYHLPVLVLANKSDQPNATPIDEIRIMFSDVLRGRIAGVFSTSVTSTQPLRKAMDLLPLYRKLPLPPHLLQL
ncbi:hypothetical protein NMY22_g10716 [Coprinellus aureogranulatus]|nr:hypothetical protein NMY22_g10716 [Coprinellus aureogranulatus]